MGRTRLFGLYLRYTRWISISLIWIFGIEAIACLSVIWPWYSRVEITYIKLVSFHSKNQWAVPKRRQWICPIMAWSPVPTALLSTIGHALGRRKQKPEIVCCFRFAAVGSVPGGARRFGSEFAQNRWPSIPVPEASQADNKEVLVGKEISELKYYSLLLTIEGRDLLLPSTGWLGEGSHKFYLQNGSFGGNVSGSGVSPVASCCLHVFRPMFCWP